MCYHDVSETMNQSSPKRARVHFLWRRVIDLKNDYSTLKLHERPNMTILHMILGMNRDDDAVRDNLEKLEQYERTMRMVNGERVSEYNQKPLAHHLSYGGSMKIGRAYSSSPLNWFPRKILNTLYKTTHVELDMVNALPSLLVGVFRDTNLEALPTYVNDQAGIFAGFKRDHGIAKDVVKKAVLAVIGSHPSLPWNYGLGDNFEAMRVFGSHPFFTGLRSDLGKISTSLRCDYAEFYEAIKTKAEKERKGDHVDGMAIAMLMQDVEHAVMRSVIDRWGADVWLYDGVLMPMSTLEGSSHEDFCEQVSMHVKEFIGVDVEFKIKSLVENSIAYSISPSEMMDMSKYAVWKRDFEKSYALFRNPPKMGRFHGGSLQFLDKTQFQHLTCAEPSEMVKDWLNDPQKRQYEMVEFAPPPLHANAGNFNSWTGFAAESMAPITDQADLLERLEPYKRHVFLLMGENQQYTDYFHKMLAYKIQNPGYNWGVMPFIRSTQGVGKDQWFKFISSMVGMKYCLSVTSVSEVMGKSSGLMENKLFVTFSEACYEDSKRHEEDLKKLITDDRMVVERKYVPSYENRMTACLVAFSNNFGAFRITTEDRRFFPVTASGKYANDPEYHVPFHAYIQDERNQRAVFQWFMEMDLDGFIPMTSRPITDTFMEMSEQSLQPFDIFMNKKLEDYVEQAIRHPSTEIRMLSKTITSRSSADVVARASSDAQYLEVAARIMWDDFEELMGELKYANLDSRAKIEKFGSRQASEFASRISKYRSDDTIPCMKNTYNKKGRTWIIDIKAVKKYLEFTTRTEE